MTKHGSHRTLSRNNTEQVQGCSRKKIMGVFDDTFILRPPGHPWKYLGLLCSYLPTKTGPTPKSSFLPFVEKIFFFFQNDDQTPVTDTTFSSSKSIISVAERVARTLILNILSLCIAFVTLFIVQTSWKYHLIWKKGPTYLSNLILMGRSTANWDIFKDGPTHEI